jgi:hypothetical protein
MSLLDLGLIGLGSFLVKASEHTVTPQMDPVKKVQLEQKKREIKKGASCDPYYIKKKELAILQRGVPLPSIPWDNPAQYSAELDLLMEETTERTPIFMTTYLPVSQFPTTIPNSGKKTTVAIMQRAASMAGLTVPLEGPGIEENWESKS